MPYEKRVINAAATDCQPNAAFTAKTRNDSLNILLLHARNEMQVGNSLKLPNSAWAKQKYIYKTFYLQ